MELSISPLTVDVVSDCVSEGDGGSWALEPRVGLLVYPEEPIVVAFADCVPESGAVFCASCSELWLLSVLGIGSFLEARRLTGSPRI